MQKTVELDLNWLAKNKLSPDDYVYLLARYKKWSFGGELKGRPRLDHLQKEGFIKRTSEGVVVREKFISLIETDFDSMFAALLARYPIKVGGYGQHRILHAVDPKAKANEKARKKYKSIVDGNPSLHEKILGLLDVQLTHTRNSLQYMQALEVWINNRSWEKWEGIETIETKSNERITRTL
jgi:hypothetical protein